MVLLGLGQGARGLGIGVSVVGMGLLIFGFGPCLKSEEENLCTYRCAVMGLDGAPFPYLVPYLKNPGTADRFGFIVADWRDAIKGRRVSGTADMSNAHFLATVLKAVTVSAPERFWGTRMAVLLGTLQVALFVASLVRAPDTASSLGDRVLVVYPAVGVLLALTTATLALLWGGGQPYSGDPSVYAPYMDARLYLVQPVNVTNTGWRIAGGLFFLVAACFGLELGIGVVLWRRHSADRAVAGRLLAAEADWNREEQLATIDTPVAPSSRALPTELGPPFIPTNANLLQPSPSSQSSPASPASGTPQPYPQSPSAYPQSPSANPQSPSANPQSPSANPQSPSSLPVNPQSPSAQSSSAKSPSAIPKSPSAIPKSPSAIPKSPSAIPKSPSALPAVSPGSTNPGKEEKEATEETSVKTTENKSESAS